VKAVKAQRSVSTTSFMWTTGSACSSMCRVQGVIRMKGTNVEEGKRMLAESGLNFATADTMNEAAEKVVALASAKA